MKTLFIFLMLFITVSFAAPSERKVESKPEHSQSFRPEIGIRNGANSTVTTKNGEITKESGVIMIGAN